LVAAVRVTRPLLARAQVSGGENMAGPRDRRAVVGLVAEGASWVAGIRAGDEVAFRALYLAYYSPLCAFVATLVDSDDAAEELAQDLLCHIWEQRSSWRLSGTTLRAYLFSSARNRAFNQMSAGRWSTPPDESAEHADFAAALARALGALPPRCRAACVLRWQQGLTYPEIATAMGITLKGVEALLTRGVKSVRMALDAFAGA
jgi:RNA polymerase sigma-70 factor (ECF subfamily)